MRSGVIALVVVAMGVGGACRRGSSRGLVTRSARVSDGYVLLAPLLSTTTYLVDRAGKVVKTWESAYPPGVSAHLLDNGNLLRTARPRSDSRFGAAGVGGRLEEIDWRGKVVWEFDVASTVRVQHHDVAPVPGGNVLVLAWEAKSREESLLAGRRPHRVGPIGLLAECLLEVRPTRPRGGVIVWEWHLWDHLVQQLDPDRAGYGLVAEHPEKVDVNGGRAAERTTDELLGRLRSLGYLAGSGTAADVDADFVHANAVAYHPRLDQVALIASQYHEVWVLDHGTTTAEAAGHAGGRSGRGGDLLYRWGNPAAYGRGRLRDQRLFGPHDARWIPDGLPGAGHLMVFSNGPTHDADVSSVLEVETPLEADGRYALASGAPYGPPEPVWEFAGSGGRRLSAEFLSGAHRLANGDTFVTAGPEGRILEVTPNGEIVWEYLNPFSGSAPNPAGDPPYSVFRATFVPADHPGLVGRDLEPLDPQPPSPGR